MTEQEKIEAIAGLTAVIALYKQMPAEIAQPVLKIAMQKLKEVIENLNTSM